MKSLYCEICETLLIKAENGSKIKKGIVLLCKKCYSKCYFDDYEPEGNYSYSGNKSKSDDTAVETLMGFFGMKK